MKTFLDKTDKINPLPWLTDQAIDFLEKYLEENKDARILEFGSGGSTLWFAKKTKNLTSIEHNVNWYKKVKQELENQNLNHVDQRHITSNYFNVCKEFEPESFDLILIDAKDRIECIKNSIPILKKNGVLMLDNAEREKYQITHEILKGWPCTITTQNTKSRLGFEQPGWQTKWWIKP